jgi:hypothetical protein
MVPPTDEVMASGFRYEYVTSTVPLRPLHNTIIVRVVNASAGRARVRVIIHQTSGLGAQVAADSGVRKIAATWDWYLGFPVPSPGDYWVRVLANSDVLVPAVSFEHDQSGIWLPFVIYRPGDFALFGLTPTRHRMW